MEAIRGTYRVAVSEPAAPGPQGPNAGGSAVSGVVFNIALTAFEVGGSILVFEFARHHGASPIAAYLWASIVPVLGIGIYALRARAFSGASAAILAFTLLSVVVAFVGRTDAKALLYKDSAVTGVVGLIFLGSLAVPRPLAYYFGQRFSTDSTPAGVAWWASLWQYAPFRLAMRLITTIWGAAYVLEAVIKAVIVHALNYNAAYIWTQILPYAAAGVALVGTVVIARATKRYGERLAAAHEGQPDPSAGPT